MPLDPSQKQKVVDWLESKNATLRCSICSTRNWIPGELIGVPLWRPTGLVIGGPTTAMVQLVCGDCFHVELFVAAPMGLP